MHCGASSSGSSLQLLPLVLGNGAPVHFGLGLTSGECISSRCTELQAPPTVVNPMQGAVESGSRLGFEYLTAVRVWQCDSMIRICKQPDLCQQLICIRRSVQQAVNKMGKAPTGC